MSVEDLKTLDHASLAKHAQEGWDLANKRTSQMREIFQEFQKCLCDNSEFSTLDCRHFRKARAIFESKPYLVEDGKTYWILEDFVNRR